MNDLIKNLKALFFSYTSIIVLLFFAILQSNQEKYDLALGDLRRLEKQAASFDSNQLRKTLETAVFGDSPKTLTTKRSLANLNVSVAFQSDEVYADFSAVHQSLVGALPAGFNFGQSDRIRLHKDFTETDTVQTLYIPVQQPLTLEAYQALHDGAQNGLFLTTLRPNFSAARLEAFSYVRHHNSIDVVTVTEYERVHIADPLVLSEPNGSEPTKSCSLRVAKTKFNGNYTFICNIGPLEIDGVQYSGARILLPALTDIKQLSKFQIMDLVGIDPNDRVPFVRAFPELADISKAYGNLRYPQAEKILIAERDRSPDKLSVFGAEINIPLLINFVVPLLIIIAAYIALHLNEANRRVTLVELAALPDIPWIGIYPGKWNERALWTQLIVLPIFLAALVIDKTSDWLQVGWQAAFLFGLIVVNSHNAHLVRQLRNKILARIADIKLNIAEGSSPS